MRVFTRWKMHRFLPFALASFIVAFCNNNTISDNNSEPMTVTFLYNGQSVTYGVIMSPVTGREWLDRNLGAPNAASAWDDFSNYGDLFQWGRAADGHQCINRFQNGFSLPVNGMTDAISTTDVPGHGQFIKTDPSGTSDWRNPSSDSLWQASDGINNPCPNGWHVPTLEEWQSENLSGGLTQAFIQLKLTGGGYRANENGDLYGAQFAGIYWSSTSLPLSDENPHGSVAVGILSDTVAAIGYITKVRGLGHAVRCIKNE